MLVRNWHVCAVAALVLVATVPAGRGDDLDLVKLKVTALTRQLGSSDPDEKIKAAGELAKLGPDGKPAAKSLARLCADPSAKVNQAAMTALEKVWPELYKAGTILLHDKEDDFGKSPKRVEACNTIMRFGDGAEAGVPFLLQHLRNHLDKDDDFFGINKALAASVDALIKLAPNDPAFHKLLTAGAAPTNIKYANRALAIRALGDLADSHPKLRSTFLPPVKHALTAMPINAGMRSHPKFNLDQVRQAAVEALGKFGKDAKSELSALKKIKNTDPIEAVRKAAADAVAKIEGDK